MSSDDRKRKKKSGAEFKKARKARRQEEEKLSQCMSRYFIKEDKGKSESPKETLNVAEEGNDSSIDDLQFIEKGPKEPVSETESPNDAEHEQPDNSEESDHSHSNDFFVPESYSKFQFPESAEELRESNKTNVCHSRRENCSDDSDLETETSKRRDEGSLKEVKGSSDSEDSDQDRKRSSDVDETEWRRSKEVFEI